MTLDKHQSVIEYVSSHFTVNIGDVVPYKNTRSNIKQATITEFEKIESNNSIWFRGFDVITKAKVWYPLHISLEIKRNGY